MSDSFLQSYDLAVKTVLYNKFASILGIDTQSSSVEDNKNLGIFQIPKEIALRVAAEKRGETFLEFINFWRMGASFSWSRNRTPLSRRGMWLDIDGTGRNTVHVKAVPIDLNYNAWFWSKDLDKVYQVIEDYVFWQQNNPKVSILYIPKDDGPEYELTPDIHFGEIVDESTVSEQYSQGIIYGYKMPIKLDAWAIKGFSFKTIHKIKVSFYDQDEITDYSEIIVADSDQDTEMEAVLRYFSKAIYDIYSVSLVDNSITVQGNFVADFVVGDKISIWNSTDNNEMYTVASDGATYVDGRTKVIVDETLTSETADGTIYK